MKAIKWVFDKSQDGVSKGVKVFNANLPGRMQDEFRKYAKENQNCRPLEIEFEIEVENKKYHVNADLPKYKGNNKVYITFHEMYWL